MAAITSTGEGSSQSWSIQNALLSVTLKRSGLDLSVADKKSGKVWRMQPEQSGFTIQKAGIQLAKPLCDLELAASREVREGEFHGVELMSVPKDPWQVYNVRVRVLLSESAPEVVISVAPHEIPGHTADVWVREVHYPRSLQHSASPKAYTVIPFQQGTLLPGNWHMDLTGEDMLGLFTPWVWESCTGPWWGHVDEGGAAYLAIIDTADDASYEFSHPSGGPTRIAPRWLTSFEAFRYARRMAYHFFAKADYTDIAFAYRDHCKRIGRWRSVEEKRLEKPQMDKHLGAIGIAQRWPDEPQGPERFGPWVHALLNSLNRESVQRRFRSFHDIAGMVEATAKRFAGESIYFMLAGWQTLGYDHAHPQACPPSAEAGGWEGMREVSAVAEKLGILFGVHEQYRDFFLSSPFFSEDLTRKDSRGDSPRHHYWAGGTQSILCPALMFDFVKMNVQQIIDQHVKLNATYQDVLTAIPLEECYDQRHPVTRSQCREARASIARYYRELGWLITSESAADWAVADLDSMHVHWARLKPGVNGEPLGIPVPLFSLVFHDAILMASQSTPAAICALAGMNTYHPEDRIIRKIQKQAGYMPLTAHHLLSDDGQEQESVFGDALSVRVNLASGKYSIKGLKGEGVVNGVISDNRM